jgi:aspartate-semialdehyde dehydrogenase
MREPRVGVVGATGVVGKVALELLGQRGFSNVRAFASTRSAGRQVPYGGGELEVEEATPAALAAGDLDVCFFSVGTDASRELVPHAERGGALCIDKSDAYRLADGVPLVVAGVNEGTLERGFGRIVANPNCSAIQLSCVLKPLHEAAGVTRVRLATYQAASGAGDAAVDRLESTAPGRADLGMDWELEGDEFSEEYKLRAETRKILGLPDLAVHATCVRVPVKVGHAQAVWIETHEPLSPDRARSVLANAPHIAIEDLPTPGSAAGRDEVLVGRIREDSAQSDSAQSDSLALWVVCDNLRKGAALNAIQIAEFLLAREALPV